MMRLRGHFHAGRPNPPAGDTHAEIASTDPLGGGAPRGDDACYRLMSIDSVGAPEGCTGSDWHIYRIALGGNEITGYRRGDLARVSEVVDTIVIALNERRDWKTKATSKAQRRAGAAARRAAAK